MRLLRRAGREGDFRHTGGCFGLGQSRDAARRGGFSGPPDIAAVVSAIGKAGYGTTVETARFDIEKMSCASCVNHVEKAFKKVPGVIEANVNLAAKTGTVRFAAGVTNAGALAKAATSAGYPAHEIKPDAPPPSTPTGATRKPEISRALVVALVLTAPVFAIEMGSHLFPAVHRFVMRTSACRRAGSCNSF